MNPIKISFCIGIAVLTSIFMFNDSTEIENPTADLTLEQMTQICIEEGIPLQGRE